MEQQQQRWDPESRVSGKASPVEWNCSRGRTQRVEWNSSSRVGTQGVKWYSRNRGSTQRVE